MVIELNFFDSSFFSNLLSFLEFSIRFEVDIIIIDFKRWVLNLHFLACLYLINNTKKLVSINTHQTIAQLDLWNILSFLNHRRRTYWTICVLRNINKLSTESLESLLIKLELESFSKACHVSNERILKLQLVVVQVMINLTFH